MFSRRSFLKHSPLVALTPTVPAFLTRSVAAGEKLAAGRILVVLELAGGNDGINTIVPYGDPAYAENRKQLRLPEARLIKIDKRTALHPAMRAVSELLESDRLAIVQGVGYPNPNRSHFRSMAIWHTARFKEEDQKNYGWLGRARDGAPRSPGSDAIFVGSEKLPQAVRGRRSVASSMLATERLSLDSPVNPQQVVGRSDSREDLTAFVQRNVLDAYATVNDLAKASGKSNNAARYPGTNLAQRLKLIAQLIKSGISTPVYYAVQGGFDTHAIQMPTHQRLLFELSTGLKAFLDDLRESKIDDRVVVMAFSEFGRRVKENGSLGTDHGTAGPILLAGPSVKPGLHGTSPRLDKLVKGDLHTSVDFRRVYATLLEQWLKLPSSPALGGNFKSLPLLQG